MRFQGILFVYVSKRSTAYHPKFLLKARLFAYSEGIFSGRKIEKMMQENLAMQWLTGQTLVSYRALNRFRVSEKN
ncbi:transposase [Marinilactibacillus psychrotolerans]|uniref:transposase n=1 Tax=Marinilactibacillus psychrotolerans TaxID=191770 RepID=UPI0038861250